MEYIAENAGHVPVPELVRGALLEMAQCEERERSAKVQAFCESMRELEQYKLAAYTAEELEQFDVLGYKSIGEWTEEHCRRVEHLSEYAKSIGLDAPNLVCKCESCWSRFSRSLQKAQASPRRMRAVAATMCRPLARYNELPRTS